MLHGFNLCQDNALCGYTEMKPPFLPFDEPNLCNDYLLMDTEYIDRYCINFFMSLCSKSSWFGYRSAGQCEFNEVHFTANQKTKKCRPTQIKIREKKAKINHVLKTRNSGVGIHG